MRAIEFQTILQNGLIEVPAELREKIQGQVRVIVLTEDETKADEPYDILTELTNNPIHAPDFKPMTRDEIYSGKRFGN